MMFLKILLVLSAFQVSSLFAEKFVIDSAHSSIDFSVKHLGIFPVKGKFNKFEGSFDYDEKSGVATNIKIKIDIDSIFTNEEDRDAHLKSKDFFNVRSKSYEIIEKNRYITFNVKTAKLKDMQITGELNILNTEKTITLKSQSNIIKKPNGGGIIGVQAEGTINRKEYGMTWQKKTTGVVAKAAGKFVGNEVKLLINIVAKVPKTKNK